MAFGKVCVIKLAKLMGIAPLRQAEKASGNALKFVLDDPVPY
jgi:hypothetical protein